MGNSNSQQIFNHITILENIFQLLNLKDQLTLKSMNSNLHDFVANNIPNRFLTIPSDLCRIENNEFLEYMNKCAQRITRLNIEGFCEFVSWKPMRNALNLTGISISNVEMHIDDVYWMVKMLTNLQYLMLHNVFFENVLRHHYDFDFTVKSLKKLQLPYDVKHVALLNKCPNLEEFIIYGIPANKILSNVALIKNNILSCNNFRYEIEALRRDFHIGYYYSVHAKKDQITNLNINCLKVCRTDNLQDILRNINLCEHVKWIILVYPTLNTFEFIVENVAVAAVEYLCIKGDLQGLHLKAFANLRILYLSYSLNMFNQDLQACVEHPTLFKITFKGCYVFKSTSNPPINVKVGFKSYLKQLIFDSSTEIFEMFFAIHPEMFEGLQQLKFIDLKTVLCPSNRLLDIPADRVIKLLAAQHYWNLRHLSFIDCCMELDKPCASALNSLHSSVEHVVLNNCFDLNGNYLQHLLTLDSLRYLTLWHPLYDEDEELENKIYFQLQNVTQSSSIRFIALDKINFQLNKQFWYNYMQKYASNIQFTIHNAEISQLKELSLDLIIRQKIKNIEFKSISGKADIPEEVLAVLPILVTELHYGDIYLTKHSIGNEMNVRSALIINF